MKGHLQTQKQIQDQKSKEIGPFYISSVESGTVDRHLSMVTAKVGRKKRSRGQKEPYRWTLIVGATAVSLVSVFEEQEGASK